MQKFHLLVAQIVRTGNVFFQMGGFYSGRAVRGGMGEPEWGVEGLSSFHQVAVFKVRICGVMSLS